MPTLYRALLPLVLVTGCINPKPVDDSTGGDDTGTTGGDDGPSIYDVNDGTVPQDEVVTLDGVVVTSGVTRDSEGFFIADPDGGPMSGLYVWIASGMGGTVMYPGDELTITGTPSEYYGWMEFVINSTDDFEVTGEAPMPAPTELADGAGVDWSQYESVVVTLEDQTIESIDQYQTATLSGGVAMDDGFQFYDHECRGHYASITGIVFYQYETYSINARKDEDLVGYTAPDREVTDIATIQAGEMCGPVTVEGVVATTQGVDDDGDGVFFVQSAGGGDGIGVFAPGATVDVSVGDVLTISGDAGDFYGFTQISIDDVATGLEVTGSGTPPVGESLTEAPADWEPYEGALVTLTDVSITSDSSYGEYETNYGVKLDTLFYESNPDNGDTFSSITGVINFNFDEFKIEPRSADDIVP